MAKPKTYFVRLKLYNRKRGYLVRNFMYRGVRFTTRWKEVSAVMAAELQDLVQPHDPEMEIALFDVKTKSEAEEIEADERDSGARNVARVKDAEPVPDRKFRSDRPTLDDATGEIMESDSIEAADMIDPADDDDDELDAAPAPSLKKKSTRKKSARTRTRGS